ncbi:ATP-binding protein [Bacillus sp. FJAT-45066]|uniref:ATP-binding protein n=1 Tax=Bacillus sp. FJAT-45066 TaxID=2011010 RepID=UPI000BB8E775|nr:ATP-binding protein [Bacillus sp. FJAT-45066]
MNMKNQKHLPKENIYWIFTITSIILMTLGSFIELWENGLTTTFIIHLLMVLVISVLLIIYPKNKSIYTKYALNIAMPIYFYAMFIMYPFTLSPFLIICFIPGIAILFYNQKLFYFSLINNVVIVISFMVYVFLVDQGAGFPIFHKDLAGYAINFLACQAMLYFIFALLQKKIEEQRQYYQQLQADERLKTTGQLAAAVAHEIRNPITVVKGFIQLYEQDKQLPEHVKKHYQLMLGELNTAETVISDFLTLAKPDVNEVESIEIKPALYNVMDLLNTYALIDTIQIELDIEDDYSIQCTLIEFKQLFVNLLKNAIEASEHGGTVRVTVRRGNSRVKIVIVDQGVGMSKEQLKRIGTPFYSLKAKGTGLGLMICFNIVQKYEGTIDFFSKEGNGTEVTVTFPLVE